MNYLVIDASTEACSVALQFNNKLFSRYELCPQSHSLRLLPMVDEVLKEASCMLSDLDGLIFGQGPGSFTGVRIGVGVAQGLAFSANLSVVGVSTMQSMAQRAFSEFGETKVLVAIDARMEEVYNGYYQLDENNIMQSQLPESVLKPSLLANHYASITKKAYGVGTGWQAYNEELNSLKTNQGVPTVLFPHANDMLIIGIAAFERGEGVCAEYAQPVYVRDTVSWQKLPGRE